MEKRSSVLWFVSLGEPLPIQQISVLGKFLGLMLEPFWTFWRDRPIASESEVLIFIPAASHSAAKFSSACQRSSSDAAKWTASNNRDVIYRLPYQRPFHLWLCLHVLSMKITNISFGYGKTLFYHNIFGDTKASFIDSPNSPISNFSLIIVSISLKASFFNLAASSTTSNRQPSNHFVDPIAEWKPLFVNKQMGKQGLYIDMVKV